MHSIIIILINIKFYSKNLIVIKYSYDRVKKCKNNIDCKLYN